MSRIHTGLKTAYFTKPYSVQEVKVCSETGLKARTGCKDTYTEYFLRSTVPGLCNKHSGTEIKASETEHKNENTNSTVQGIKNDIDAEEPIMNTNVITTTDSKKDNTANTNSNKNTNTNTNINENINSNTNKNTNTNSSSNSNINTNDSKNNTNTNENKTTNTNKDNNSNSNTNINPETNAIDD